MSKLWIISSFILCLSVVVLCFSNKELPETGSKPVHIIAPPRNTTILEHGSAKFSCSAIGTPNNITYNWYHKGVLISHLPWLGTRTSNKSESLLIIQSTTSDDSGKFTCEATNGIGEPDTAFAYLRVDHPARVTYSPSRQYLSLGFSGIVKCYIQASPPVDFVIWTKDSKEFDPSTQQNVEILTNGSLYFSEITRKQEGLYRCKPYNSKGIERGSDPMEVIVKDPPKLVMNGSYTTGLDLDNFQAGTANGTAEESIDSTKPSIIEIFPDQNLNFENKNEDNNTFLANPRKIAEVIFCVFVVTIIILSVCLVIICKKRKQHKKEKRDSGNCKEEYSLKQSPPKWTFKCLKLTQRLKVFENCI